MATKKSGRGIALSRDSLLKARKVKHNMTQEDLAAALRIDVREIQRAEAEQHIDPAFAHRIAAILGVDLADLVKKGPVASTDTPPQKEESPAPETPQKSITITRYSDGRVTVEMVFDKHYAPPLEKPALDLARAIAMFVGFQDGFGDDDVKVAAGSLRVTIPLSRRDTALLMNAFIAGELEQFDVVSINVATNTANNSQSPDTTPDASSMALRGAITEATDPAGLTPDVPMLSGPAQWTTEDIHDERLRSAVKFDLSGVAAKTRNDQLSMSTAEIGLTVRTAIHLETMGIFTVQDLLNRTPEELLNSSSFGEQMLEEIYKALESIGFYRR
jgi:DNA-directed RNA polymerase subunit alpha